MHPNQPHNGKNMSLSDEGSMMLTSKIRRRFNEKTIEKIARGGCGNISKNFWGMNIKFSEGKRLNYDHTDVSTNLVFVGLAMGYPADKQ